MKRRVIVGAVLTVLVCVCAALGRKALEPADFTGTWYRAGDGACCIFEEGLIRCDGQEGLLPGEPGFSGAYSFAGNKAAVFTADDRGVGEVVELHLIRRRDGDILCETEDGKGPVRFYRSREAACR